MLIKLVLDAVMKVYHRRIGDLKQVENCGGVPTMQHGHIILGRHILKEHKIRPRSLLSLWEPIAWESSVSSIALSIKNHSIIEPAQISVAMAFTA